MRYRFSQTELANLEKQLSSNRVEGASELCSSQTSMSQMLRDASQDPRFRRNFCQNKEYPREKLDAVKALMLVERIRLCFSASGQPNDLKPESYPLLLIQWCELYRLNKAEKIAKYLSANIFSFITHQDLLEPIELPFGWNQFSLGGGRWWKWIRSLKNLPMSRSKLEAAQNFLYLKKGVPVASEDFIIENLKKHRKALSTKKKLPEFLSVLNPDNSVESCFFKRELKKRIRGVVNYIRNSSTYEPPTFFWEPSSNASFGTKRSTGGLASALKWNRDEEMVEKKFFNHKLIDVPVIVDGIELERTFKCEAVPICEPFKVRVITKGPSNATYALKGLQIALWKAMRSLPVFALIGRTMRGDDVPFCLPNEFLNSGDFSAATDNLLAQVSKYVGREIGYQFDYPEELLVASLSKNFISYGVWEKKCDELKPFEQKNGQLMGSVLSFLVLCIANAALHWMVKFPHTTTYDFSVMDPLLKINGDDCLCPLTKTEQFRWNLYADAMGLIPSVGKTYFSRDFAVLNSQCYMKSDLGDWTLVPYLNGDYLQPVQGKGGRLRSVLDFAALQRGFTSGFEGKKKRDLDRFFVECHKDTLMSDAGQIHWYLSKAAGGLGLETDDFVQISPQNRRRAYACLSGWSPYKISYKDFKHENIVGKHSCNKLLKSLGLMPGPKVVKKEWEYNAEYFLEGRRVEGVSSIVLQALTGKVIRDDTEDRAIRPMNNRRYLKGISDRYFGYLLERLGLDPQRTVQQLTMNEYTEECGKLKRRFWTRDEVETALVTDFNQMIVGDGEEKEKIQVPLPEQTPELRSLGWSRYQSWIWSKYETWKE